MKTNQLLMSGIRYLGIVVLGIFLGASFGRVKEDAKLLVHVDRAIVSQIEQEQPQSMEVNFATLTEQNVIIRQNQSRQNPVKRTVVNLDNAIICDNHRNYNRRQAPVVINNKVRTNTRADCTEVNTS